MIHKRETADDLVKQERLFQVFSNHMNCDYSQFHSSSKKYRIDGYCYDSITKNIVCWVECKWYSRNAHCFLNVPKFNELIELSTNTELPSYFLFREFDKWGYILIHDGKNLVCDYTGIKKLGGTPPGRVVNYDDIEPVIVLNRNGIKWGN